MSGIALAAVSLRNLQAAVPDRLDQIYFWLQTDLKNYFRAVGSNAKNKGVNFESL